jgi:hypothetical protein
MYLKYNGHTKKAAKTDTNGNFTFTNVNPITSGAYTLKAYKYHVIFDAIASLGTSTTDVAVPLITGATVTNAAF